MLNLLYDCMRFKPQRKVCQVFDVTLCTCERTRTRHEKSEVAVLLHNILTPISKYSMMTARCARWLVAALCICSALHAACAVPKSKFRREIDFNKLKDVRVNRLCQGLLAELTHSTPTAAVVVAAGLGRRGERGLARGHVRVEEETRGEEEGKCAV